MSHLKKKLSLLAAIAASVTSPLAFAVVDGTVSGGEYTTILATQNTPTGFGNNFSELNQAHASYTAGGPLSLALTGNLETNGNSIVVFIDSKPNGGIINAAGGGFGNVGPQQGFRTDDWNGATLAPNFNPDYSLEISNDPNGYHFNVIDLSLTPGDPNKDIYLGQFNPASGPYSTDYFRDGGATLAGNIQHQLDNTNVDGVNGYDFGTPPGPLGDPSTATKGFEFIFDSTFLGHTAGAPVRMMAVITNGGGDFLSNQLLPGVNGDGNLGGPGSPGGDSIFDSRVYGDEFYMTAFVPTTGTTGDAWTAATWTGGAAPNGAETAALLTGSGASTITLDETGITLGYLKLDNSAGWTINDSGGSTLTFNGGNGSAALLSPAGDHTISAKVLTATAVRVRTSGGSVSFTDGLGMAAGTRITKAGAGTLTIGGTQTNGAGSSIAVDGGNLVLNSDLGTGLTGADRPDIFVSRPGANSTATFNASQHLDQLHVNDTGVATITPTLSNVASKVVVANSFSADSLGKLDMGDNKLIVKEGADLGTWDGGSSAYTGLTGQVQRGRGDGSWNGTGGILTTMTDATTSVLTTVAIGTGAEIRGLGPTDTDVWGGETIDGDDVLVMYTWGGDADMNGELNGDDYFYIDSNVVNSGSVFGFHQGDFDYNGTIDGDDYFIIDSNITFAQQSGIIFPTGAGGGGLAAVPEPASIGLMSVAACGLLRRRRRN